MARTPPIDTTVLATVATCVWGWLTWLVFWPLGLIGYLPLAAWASGRGRRSALFVVLASPFTVVPLASLVAGGLAWRRGDAALQRAGWSSAESRNLDPQLRVPIAPPVWHLDGREPFRQRPYNAALRLLGQLGGPMRGGYTGPYPQRDRAWYALDTAQAAGPGTYTWYGEPIPVLARTDVDLRAAFSGHTLIIGHADQLWLVDSATSVAFATYRRPQGVGPLNRWPKTPAPTAPATQAPQLNASPPW